MSLIQDISEYIRSGEKKGQKLGLEIEHFVIDAEGKQIGFHEVEGLIEGVIAVNHAAPFVVDGHTVGYDTGEYTVTLEPSCQFEVSIYPESDLEVIRRIYEDFYGTWEPLFAERGYQIVSAGILPSVELGLQPVEEIPLSSKKRYQFMNRHFETSGRFGKYMMRASSSAQVSVDYESESDLVRKIRILEKIAPILMILMENKASETSALPGHPYRHHLLRTQVWEDLDPARTGYFPGSFDSDFGYDKIAGVIAGTPLILLTDGEESTYVGDKTARDLIAEGELDYESRSDRDRKKLLEHFISMGFFHMRIKKYIEIRVADSVSIDKALAYTALMKGLLYSEDSLKELEEKLQRIGSVEEIESATQAIEYAGFDALIYEGKSAAEWAQDLIEIAGRALDENEKEFLENL